MSDWPLLQQLAQAHGVQTSYETMTGERVTAQPEALVALLRVLGVEAGNTRQIRSAIKEHDNHIWNEPLGPAAVQWNRRPSVVRACLPGSHSGRFQASVHLEDGSKPVRLNRNASCVVARVESGDRTLDAVELTLPPLPCGYHELELEAGGRRWTSWIISAPTRSYSERNRRDWGLFLPMYAARTEQNWGSGNLSDWRQLCDWTASLGGRVAGTLPLTAAFLDHPQCDPSPYSPASRLFWNEFYLDITRIPEFEQSATARKHAGETSMQRRLKRFRSERLVDYEAEWRARREVLEILADEFFSKQNRKDRFERFLKERPEVRDYAAFRAVCDQRRESWHVWPRRLRDGELRAEDFDERTRNFHLYIQWQMQEQVDDLISHCREINVQFYLDLPLGVHPDGYDVWRQRSAFAFGASAGAPPDSFFTLGQDWGFAPLHPQRIRQQRYRYVIDYLRFQMRHTGLLRIDHVMGLHRLYWIPHGFKPTDGIYVRYAAEELHAILSVESHRYKTTLIGENLGTVPPEVNDAMARHDLRGMFVAQYQQRPDPKSALDLPAQRTVASLNTHDIPTFAAHWKGLEIVDHTKLGLVARNQVRAKRSDRAFLNEALVAFLRKQRLVKGKADLQEVLPAVLEWLARSPAEIVLINLEDLVLEEQPQNMPGTYKERPNWRRKTMRLLSEIMADPAVKRALRRVAAHR
ncbi:MAG TPA: 4-alpha-glucanotransferase [Verrucomicrobiae bacterium]|nr:4-alpha-glucanotransferase [Verrucomicrobiae bacterium]